MTHAPNEPCLDKRDSRQMPDEIYATDCRFHTDAMPLWHSVPTGTSQRYIRADLIETRAASVPSDLVLCRRVVKPSEHEGDTGYEYFEPVQDYVPSDIEPKEKSGPEGPIVSTRMDG